MSGITRYALALLAVLAVASVSSAVELSLGLESGALPPYASVFGTTQPQRLLGVGLSADFMAAEHLLLGFRLSEYGSLATRLRSNDSASVECGMLVAGILLAYRLPALLEHVSANSGVSVAYRGSSMSYLGESVYGSTILTETSGLVASLLNRVSFAVSERVSANAELGLPAVEWVNSSYSSGDLRESYSYFYLGTAVPQVRLSLGLTL